MKDKTQTPWFPGHVAKAARFLRLRAAQGDFFLVVLDARIPFSTRPTIVEEFIGRVPCIFVLHKADLADPAGTAAWVDHLAGNQISAYPVSAATNHGVDKLRAALAEMVTWGTGTTGKPGSLRILLMGCPNVGKSFLLNRLAGRAPARTGATPGLTRGPQLVRLAPRLLAWDTPGVLPPRTRNENSLFHLALGGVLPEGSYDPESTALKLLALILARDPSRIESRYGFPAEELPEQRILEAIGERRGCLVKGGTVDLHRAATVLLGDFREGRLGRWTLEDPQAGSEPETTDPV